jgi:hypothetical protein
MTTTNSQAGLAGLASISTIVAVLSVLSALGFGVIETLTRLRSGRREQLVVGSGQPKKHYTGTSDASVPMPQFDPSAMASASSDPRNLYSAQNVPAVGNFDRDLYMLEEAFWRESAPDTGPRRVHYPPDEPDEQDRVERYVGAGWRNRELEYVGHQVRRSPGAHRRSSSEAKFGIAGEHLGRIWRRAAGGGGHRAVASGIANRA